MASVFKVLLAFLHKLHCIGDYVKRLARRWPLFLVFRVRDSGLSE